jgi:hypothetical protein
MVGGPHYASLFPDSPEAKEQREWFHERARMLARILRCSLPRRGQGLLRQPSLLRAFDDRF